MKTKKITANIPEYIKSLVEKEERVKYTSYTYPECKNPSVEVKKVPLSAGIYNFAKSILP